MIIKLTERASYDLSDDSRAELLKSYIAKFIREEETDKIEIILDAVKPYATYNADEKSGQNARKIYEKLKSLGQVPDEVLIHRPRVKPLSAPAPAPKKPIPPTVPVPRAVLEVKSTAASLPPLYLPSTETGVVYLVSMIPMNSSGDIYHMLAYLMLALEANPQTSLKFQLNYDREVSTESGLPLFSKLTVGDQVKRSLDFAHVLGLQDYFISHELPYNNSGQIPVRESVLRKHFIKRAESGEHLVVVDQMATTMMIAARIQQIGHQAVTTIIREGFSRRNPAAVSSNMLETIEDVVTQEMNALSAERGDESNKPLIILHVRFAKIVNKEQNLTDSFVLSFVKFIRSKLNYQVYLLTADDRTNSIYPNKTGYCFNPFKEKLLEDGRDYAKLLHVSLLTRLQQLPNTKGVVGNTSGTLDIAALIGLCTYNIHSFTEAKISYQECRLFLQLTFLSVEALNKEHPEVLSDALKKWLENPGQTYEHHAFQKTAEKQPLQRTIFSELDSENSRKLFTCTFFSKKEPLKTIPLPIAKRTVKALFEEQKTEGPALKRQ